MKLCNYHHDAPMFAKKYRDIQSDLAKARHCLEDKKEHGLVDAIEDNIDALLGVDQE
jgi:hypothetical protein